VSDATKHRGGRPPVGPLTELRLPAEWRDDLDALAEERGTSRAVLIRRAIADTYGEHLTPLDLDAPHLDGRRQGTGPRPRSSDRLSA
jgi:predicted DNA-binding protein